MYTNYSFKRRVTIFALICVIVFTLLAGRVFFLQIINGSNLQILAAEQWYRDLPLTAARGDIYDINGNVLSKSVNTYNVYVRPASTANAAHVAWCLALHLNINEKELLDKIEAKSSSEILVKMQVQKDVALKIVSYSLSGVYLSENSARFYPYEQLASQVLGYTSVDGVGQEGVENYYNNYLKGVDGKALTEADLKGQELENSLEYYVPSIAGLDLTLNIDIALQAALEQALVKTYTEQKAKQTYGTIYNNLTGAIVAQATIPNYSLNDVPRDDAAVLLNNIKNKSVTEVIEPGSTFKILTLAAALEEGLVDENELFHCCGNCSVDGEKIKCWKTKGHGTQTLQEAINNSCNMVFVELGLRLGVEKYYYYLEKFGLGQKTGVDAAGESSGILMPEQSVRTVDLARIAFGQAVAVTPLQLQSILGAIVSGGVLYTPQIASSISKDGEIIYSSTPVVRERIISEQTSAKMQELLRGVVLAGSGKSSYVDGYYIGGKTGTAQKYKDGAIDVGKYLSSYFGFIMIDGVAKYSVMIYVDEPSAYGYYGGVVAAPYAKNVFEAIIIEEQQKPSTELLNGNLSALDITVPAVIGKNIIDAVALLQSKDLFVQVDGDGLSVVGMFPSAGTKLSEGDLVVIFTESG